MTLLRLPAGTRAAKLPVPVGRWRRDGDNMIAEYSAMELLLALALVEQDEKRLAGLVGALERMMYLRQEIAERETRK